MKKLIFKSKKIRQAVHVMLCLAMCVALMPVISAQAADLESGLEVEATGKCGEDITWTLNNKRELIFSGTGIIPGNYGSPFVKEYYYDWDTIIIEEGITGIDYDVFTPDRPIYDEKRKVYIADSVEYIGDQSFFRCPIGYVYFGENSKLKTIDRNAFRYTKIETLELPSSVTSIAQFAFASTPLIEITIPASVQKIGGGAFEESSLSTVYYGGTQEQWNTLISDENSGKDNDELKNAKVVFPHTHEGTKVAQVDATCIKEGVKEYYTCSCGKVYEDLECTKEITDLDAWKAGDGKIAMKAHTYATAWITDGSNHWHACSVCGAKKDNAAHTLKTTTTIKATTSADGKKETKCTVCSKVTKTDTIKAVKTIKLAETTYVYDGNKKNPAVIVKDSAGNAIAKTGYTVSYATGRKNVGKYGVKVTFKGDYSGTKKLNFTINPKATSIKSVTAAKKGFTVKWTKQTKEVSGYELQYATNSKFSAGLKKEKIAKTTTVSKKITKLKAKKTYYVRIRTYKKKGSTTYYSSWTKVEKVKTK